jgi:hypothetical protein
MEWNCGIVSLGLGEHPPTQESHLTCMILMGGAAFGSFDTDNGIFSVS